jgi:hypothetical protein
VAVTVIVLIVLSSFYQFDELSLKSSLVHWRQQQPSKWTRITIKPWRQRVTSTKFDETFRLVSYLIVFYVSRISEQLIVLPVSNFYFFSNLLFQFQFGRLLDQR